MRIINVGNMSVEVFDAEASISQPMIVKVTATDTQSVNLYASHDATGTILATYQLDANHQAVIDVADYARTFPLGAEVVLAVGYMMPRTIADISFVNTYLIQPDAVLVPANCYAERLGGGLILPPSKMIQSSAGVMTAAEVYTAEQMWMEAADEVTHEEYIYTDLTRERYVSFSAGVRVCRYGNGEDVEVRQNIIPRLCGCRYVDVRWVSFSGVTRQHTMQVFGGTIASEVGISLADIRGGYDVAKKRTDGLVIGIEQLNAYDYWYYADIMHSQKVEVSLDGGESWTEVEVTDDQSDTILADGERNDLKLNINYKKYDAVIM